MKCCVSEIPIKKDGILYEKIKPDLKPLDLLLFKGTDFIGKTITLLQQSRFKNKLIDFTHSGIVVTKEILDNDILENGKLYILESVLSGKLARNVYNIRGKGYIGVQLRDLDEVIKAYDIPDGTRIAHCQLQNNPFNDKDKCDYLKSQFTAIFEKYDGIKYDFNFISLLSAIYPVFRCMRSQIEDFLHTDEWLFCSELSALVYKEMGLLSDSTDERDVLPIDFINGIDEDNSIPYNFVADPVYIITDLHT